MSSVARRRLHGREKGTSTYDGEPSKQLVERLIQKLQHKHKLSDKRVTAPEDLVEVRRRIHGGEETAVEPTPPLHDEVRHLRGHVRLAGGGLDVLQDPMAVPLGDELEAQYPVFGKIHVGGEDTGVGTVHLLAGKVLLQRPLARLVVLERDVAVG